MKKNLSKRFGNNKTAYYVFMLLGILFLGSVLFVMINKRSEPFENSPSTSKVNIEYFYMESCPYCVQFDPVWKTVSEDPQNSGVTFIKRNIKENADLANKHNINSAPTIVAVDKTSGIVVSQFTEARDEANFSKFVSTYR
jgi:thiol-disulfide isomerase/thioredoxin